MRLVATDISCPTDGVGVLHIAGTSNGRVFLAGDDGCLYELQYSQADTIWGAWSGRHTKARKINHTSGAVRCAHSLELCQCLCLSLLLTRCAWI